MKQQQKTVHFITLIIILTIGIQLYWNYIQYLNNRKLVKNEIQQTLDNVTADYTKNLLQKSILPIKTSDVKTNIQSADSSNIKYEHIINEISKTSKKQAQIKNGVSIQYSVISERIILYELYQKLEEELKKLNYKIDYNLTIKKNGITIDSVGSLIKSSNILSAQSSILPNISTNIIHLNYKNPILPTLLKGLTGILTTFVLCFIVIFALYYLLYIIKKQKQLSEIKNDFISNVTHEFKTPISTVSSAIEAIKNFNETQISEKTLRYLEISEQQLKKLNLMVEKVMETSLLETSEIPLERVDTELVALVKSLYEKTLVKTTKKLTFNYNLEKFNFEVDLFHFENAISNLLENAIKYGGDEISIDVKSIQNGLSIAISDNGIGISKEDEPFIFDKFFRGSAHSKNQIKGFGIGLYYTKQIVEKHGGKIELYNRNNFVITLWKK